VSTRAYRIRPSVFRYCDGPGGRAGDDVQMVSAFWHAGIHMRDAGAYNDDLRACQLGLIKLGEAPDSQRQRRLRRGSTPNPRKRWPLLYEAQ
jgi:hypothetical protein